MHEFIFGYDLSDQDCLDINIQQKFIDTGIQSQIDFIIAFDIPSYDDDNIFSSFKYDLNHIIFKNFKNDPELILCKFRGIQKYVAIFWHD